MKKGWLHKNLYGDVFSAVGKNLPLVGGTVLLDILFFFVLYFLQRSMSALVPSLPASGGIALSFSVIAVMLLDFFIVLFLYSLFKYSVLHLIRKMEKNSELDFRMLSRFYGMNLLLMAIFMAVYLAIGGILQSGLRPEFLQIMAIVLSVIFFLFTYTWLNITHSLFAASWKTEGVLRKSLSILFRKIPFYASVFVFSTAVLLGFGIAYYLAGMGLQRFGWDVQIFVQIFTVLNVIVFYGLLVLNRIGFYRSFSKGE